MGVRSVRSPEGRDSSLPWGGPNGDTCQLGIIKRCETVVAHTANTQAFRICVLHRLVIVICLPPMNYMNRDHLDRKARYRDGSKFAACTAWGPEVERVDLVSLGGYWCALCSSVFECLERLLQTNTVDLRCRRRPMNAPLRRASPQFCCAWEYVQTVRRVPSTDTQRLRRWMNASSRKGLPFA